MATTTSASAMTVCMSVISMPFALARSWESGFGSEASTRLRPGVHHQGGDSEAGGAEPDLAYHLLAQLEPGLAAGDERRRERDDGRAVDVVVHDGLGERLDQAGLYLEALRRRDVLQVDAAERRARCARPSR